MVLGKIVRKTINLLFILIVTSSFISISGVIAKTVKSKNLNKQLKVLQNIPLLDNILRTMDEKYKKIESFEMNFEQTKNLMLMANPIHSKGVLIFKRPANFYWKFNNPDPTIMVLNGSRLIIHYPDLKQADIMDIGKYKKRVAKYLGFTDSMLHLKRYYKIRVIEEGKTTYYLELIPKRRRIKHKIKLLEIWLSRETYLPVKIHYQEPNDDSTLIKITETKINLKVDDSLFDYILPDGTKRNYPIKKKKISLKKKK